MIQIGQLRVHLAARQIYLDGRRVQIGSRAFDVLELLIAGKGELVRKDEILKRVWPETVVEENNIQVQVSALRRLLGDERNLIQTVPGRGYRLDANDRAALGAEETDDVDAVVATNLPACSSKLIGREEAIVEVSQRLRSVRLVTLVGAGGIGKTRLGICVARGLLPDFVDGAYLVCLACATDASTVLQAVGKALGMKSAMGPSTLARIVKEIGRRRMLVVLDNCEHVLESAAELAQALLQHCPGTHVLATSREALRVPDETLYSVAALDFPNRDNESHEVLQCSAVKLFLSRARALNPGFSFDAQSISLTGTACRRLDGIPLAIELAAARAAMLGIHTLVAHLDDRFRLLTGGHRTALPRHQTLKATLDWSYGLLDDDEQSLLRRLGIFSNAFTMAGASAVMGDAWQGEGRTINALGGLIAKSLVIADSGMHERRYRLLETTHAYAMQKLDDNGEHAVAARNHARYLCNLLDGAGASDTEVSIDRCASSLRDELDDMRAALRWVFSPRGDDSLGVALAERAVCFFFEASLVEECCEWAERALKACVRSKLDCAASGRTRMRLLAAYAAGRIYIHGPDEQTRTAWLEVLSTAISLGRGELKGRAPGEAALEARDAEASDFEARALWGSWNTAQYSGAADQALGFAQQFASLAAETDNPANTILGDRLLGVSLHYAGRQTQALTYLERILDGYDEVRHRLAVLESSIDHRTIACATLARVLWMENKPEQARAAAQRALTTARDADNEMVAGYVLVEATIPLALLGRRREEAKEAIALLQDMSARAGLSIWQRCCQCYEACMAANIDPSPARLAAFHSALIRLEEIGFRAHSSMLSGYYAMSLGKAGRVSEGIAVVDRTLIRCDRLGERWFCGELRRMRDELLVMAVTPDHAEGQDCDA
jgi:predicted ATPase/DNA-binding winged helix-turn-helix (wHTH) protein